MPLLTGIHHVSVPNSDPVAGSDCMHGCSVSPPP
jgi:hypothetical protein